MQGIVIAGTHSGCGKTTITLGILAALKRKGLAVQPFKTGPDFIDSGIHRIITNRPSRNLDLWMCGEEYVKERFMKHTVDADMAVVEGVMGMYDGEFSTVSLAQLLHLPVILVVDAYGMAESAGAVVKGFAEYGTEKPPLAPLPGREGIGVVRSEISFAGVIFNRVASERHYERLKRSVSGIPVLGYLPRDLNFEIPHRHLGLTIAEENPISDENLNRLADTVLKYIDITAIITGSSVSSRPLNLSPSLIPPILPLNKGRREEGLLKIAVAYDKAFCFYYQDNLDLLEQAGAQIVKFSPLADPSLPAGIDAVYLGGGYPELYARELTGNISMLTSIRDWSKAGRPLYAECGGLMYLSRGIFDFDGDFFAMAGVFPFETRMKKGRSRLGYREILLDEDCVVGRKGDRLRGHEFHYSEITTSQQSPVSSRWSALDTRAGDSGLKTGDAVMSLVYSVKDADGQEIGCEGYRTGNTLASYIHLHFGSRSGSAKDFADFIKEERWKI